MNDNQFTPPRLNENAFNACQLTRADGKPVVISREKARRFDQAFPSDNDRVTILGFSDGDALHVRESVGDAVRSIGRCVDGLLPDEPLPTEIRKIDSETIEIFGTRYSVAVFQALGCDFPASVGHVLRVDKKQDGVVTVTRLPAFERVDPDLVTRASNAHALDRTLLSVALDLLLRTFVAAANGNPGRSLRGALAQAVEEWFPRNHGAPGNE